MLRILFLTLTVLPHIGIAQTSNFNGSWTNGLEFYWSKQLNDSTIQFEGGNLHEAGSAFMIRLRNDHKWYISGRREHEEDDDSPPSLGNKGALVEYKEVGGIKVLLIMQDKGLIGECLRKMKENESLEDVCIENKINYELAGKYINPRTKKEVTFFAGKPEVEGLATSRKYHFESEYDYPVNAISFDNRKSFYYQLTEDGLDIFNCKEENEEWKKKEKIMTLRKTEWFNFSGNADLKGRYPFASTLVLIDDIVGCFSLKQLKLMRNEIFARHGLIFKSAEWSNYFAKQAWYKGELDNVNDRLTELERLNIQLISRMEEIKSKPTDN